MRKKKLSAYLVGMSLAASSAFSETEAPLDTKEVDSSAKHRHTMEEIVVTGTSLRGTAPTGSQLIMLDQQMIETTGAMSSAELLNNLPQMSDFGRTPAVRGRAGTNDVVNYPSLRGLPPTGGSNPTLLLVDGHRVAPAGIRQAMADADTLPPSVIERVEVLADGGSSLYGADAVAGVINYITRKRFDGLEVSARYGMADDYHAVDAGFMAGKEWDRGAVIFAFSRSENDSLYGRDRDYIQRQDWRTGIALDRTCNPGNVSIGGASYALPDMVAGTVNSCDIGDHETFYPKREQDSFFSSVTYDLTERVVFDLRGWYTERKNTSDAGPMVGTVTLTPSNPFYQSIGGATATSPQTVRFNFEPVFGAETRQVAEMETWGIRPSLTVDLGRAWQLRAGLNYGKTENTVDNAKLNTSALARFAAGTTTATALNPYDIPMTNPALLQTLRDWKDYGRGQHELTTVRAALDGPVISIPGGEVRAAIGTEYIREEYAVKVGEVPVGGEDLLEESENDRNIKAIYAELNIPIVGDANRLPGVHALSLSLSSRYDDYSDFGSTTNSKIGLTFEPLDWVKLRASWSQSFQAPSLFATTAGTTELLARPSQVIRNPNVAPPAGAFYQLFISGGNPDLQPQEAETASYGISIQPPAVPNLFMSLDYYQVEIEDQISAAPMFSADFFEGYPDAYTMFPSAEELARFAAAAPGGSDVLGGLAPNVPVYIAVDQRLLNLSSVKVSGVDLQMSYSYETSFGHLFAHLNWTRNLDSKRAPRTGMPYGDNQTKYGSRDKIMASFGIRTGNVLAQISSKYRSGFDVADASVRPLQSSVSSWSTIDLHTRYDMPATDGLLAGVSLSLHVDNLFDKEPSTYRGLYNQSHYGYANPLTHLGRQVQFGINKSF